LDLPSNLERLPDAAEVRVLQEALTNIHRHAENTAAEIHFEINDVEVALQVRDHGQGIPPELLKRFQKTGGETGVGLSGMRERVNELGGRLQRHSDSQGTLVSVTLPVSYNSVRNSRFLSNPARREVQLGLAQFKHDRRVIGRLLRAAWSFINFASFEPFSELG
jgi:signal transduction histidine kinase